MADEEGGNEVKTHYRAPIKNDSRVALCDRKWCQWNTVDWEAVTCPECLKLREAYEAWEVRGNDFEHAPRSER